MGSDFRKIEVSESELTKIRISVIWTLPEHDFYGQGLFSGLFVYGFCTPGFEMLKKKFRQNNKKVNQKFDTEVDCLNARSYTDIMITKSKPVLNLALHCMYEYICIYLIKDKKPIRNIQRFLNVNLICVDYSRCPICVRFELVRFKKLDRLYIKGVINFFVYKTV